MCLFNSKNDLSFTIAWQISTSDTRILTEPMELTKSEVMLFAQGSLCHFDWQYGCVLTFKSCTFNTVLYNPHKLQNKFHFPIKSKQFPHILIFFNNTW